MIREQFLNEPDVSGFVQWFCTKLSKFPHAYFLRREKINWQCASFYEACERYQWNGCDWGKTRLLLNDISICLRNAIKNMDDEVCLMACSRILQWGGVSRGNQEKLEEIDRTEGLLPYLLKAKEALQANPEKCLEEGVVMNSGFTKIYSLYVDDFVIYDSRVGAALCYLIRLYCEECGYDYVPGALRFAYGNGRGKSGNRNPCKGKYKFRLLDQGKVHIDCNIKASWLLKRLTELPACEFEDVRSIEAALFMIGYEIPQ